MNEKLFLVLMLVLLALPCHAALPPQYQRAAEFKSIFEDANVVDAFPRSVIVDRAEYIKSDLYKVSAGQCFLYVTLKEKPLPDGMVGARQFDLEIGNADCPEE